MVQSRTTKKTMTTVTPTSTADFDATTRNTSTLVNTLDLVSVGSESRKKSLNNFDEKSNNTLNVKDDLDLHSSSSSDTGNN